MTQQRAIALVVTLLLPATALAAADVSALRGKSSQVAAAQGDPSDEGRDQPSCSCDCCDVVRRIPGEIQFGAGIKCSPSVQHSSDMCGAQCSPDKEDTVLKDAVVDFERFCFFECRPAAGPKAPEKSQCVAFNEAEAAKISDKDGNPMDPAFLYGMDKLKLSNQRPVMKGALLSSASRLAAAPAGAPAGAGPAGAEPGGPDAVDPKAAKTAALKGRASAEKEGKDASKEAAALREMEHAKQQELNTALKASGNGVVTLDPFAAIQDLSVAAVKARVDAEKASLIAAQAVSAYDKGRQKVWKLALGEAGKEVLRWKKHAEDKAKSEWEARIAPTWQSRALKAAQKASKPYIEGLLRAQDSVKLYNGKGFATAQAASSLWKTSQFEADKANKLPRNTIAQQNLAQSDMLDAREKAKEAQSMALESRQFFATAAEVRKGIPQYQFNAQKAAAQAVATLPR